jgi:hypothetical protein
VVLPAGTVVVRVLTGPTGPFVKRALLDGVLHDIDPSGRLVVSGLAAGPHTLVLGPSQGYGSAWKFTLREGERREEVLPPR